MKSRENHVSVKSAVKAAISYVKDLYADSNLRDLMLEEVEFSEGANQWLVTVGFSLPETKEDAMLVIPINRPLSRRYKVIKINAETGEPVSMKIRAV
jgi:hypothetical protein